MLLIWCDGVCGGVGGVSSVSLLRRDAPRTAVLPLLFASHHGSVCFTTVVAKILHTWFGLLYSIDLIPYHTPRITTPRRGLATHLATTPQPSLKLAFTMRY